MDTITHPYNPEKFIEPQNIVEYILTNPTKKTKGVINGIEGCKNVAELVKSKGIYDFLATEKPNALLNKHLQSKGNIIIRKSIINKAIKKHHLPISFLQKIVEKK